MHRSGPKSQPQAFADAVFSPSHPPVVLSKVLLSLRLSCGPSPDWSTRHHVGDGLILPTSSSPYWLTSNSGVANQSAVYLMLDINVRPLTCHSTL
ncbi:hypothetical protein AB1N83_010638 [Pleurotus pulmonarius]